MTPGPRVIIGQYSSAGRKARNDDSYGVLIPEQPLLLTKGIAMAIADGMSSSEAAKEASETCVKSFLDDYYSTHESWTAKKSVAAVLKATNNWLYAQGQTVYLSNRGMVSTFTGLVLKAGLAHIFHAGDTRISLIRDGTLEPLTRDHRVRASRSRDYLSRAMGIDPDLEVDYRSEPLEAGDILVFTSDGVHDHVEGSRIFEIIAHAKDAASGSGDDNNLDVAAQAVAQAAFDNASEDNLTCQLVQVVDPGQPDEQSHLRQLTALPFPPDLSPGMTFEGYRIISELHAGKRVQVYLAADFESKARVVIKTPSVNYEDDPAYIEMFTREEWVGRRLRSPHVVAVVADSKPKRFLYFITEFVDGDTLRVWMEKNPKPKLTEVRRIAEQIAIGLRAFHRKDMVHQDLKPENIMIDEFGAVKIIDFGSTGIAGLQEIDAPSEIPTLVGTIGYTAPEYHLEQKPTNRADIFSLGVIVFEMLTGKLPYGEGFTNARSIARLKPISATSCNAAIPFWVSAALAKATHRDPAKRYDALSAFIYDLGRPNSNLEKAEFQPLMERNPVAFWKWLALGSLLINLALLYAMNVL
ncbi:MAG: bifunctional protein-serine/threonine kinase/phosphatase [Rhodospirillaceae bacterium]|nr:bifunctional protein-serine/threonine kinase/phosphatase [Rhodospirillaceae bacterium]MBT5047227.1 bifunctional protein-serine/threonine kinase/phosphatase [Rhodospirillaceae bacterium]MBT7755927.1 bifunctional protein-serine/threonine kinase/phosphatase [Rhodospirillaceae bacterium]